MFEQHALSSRSVSNVADPFSLLFSSFFCFHLTELRIFQNAHAYLCQHRCLTATSSWVRARCGKVQWDSRSWLEPSARTYRSSHGPPELQCERVVIEEPGDHSAGHRASEGRRDVFRDGEERDEAARDPARLGCGPVRLDRYTCADSIKERLQMQ